MRYYANAVREQAWQGNIELSSEYVTPTDDAAYSDKLDKVEPGETVTVYSLFELEDTTTDVIITCSSTAQIDGSCVTKTFVLNR